MKLQTKLRIRFKRRRHNKKLVVIKLVITHRDERMMSATVMPPEHLLRQTASPAQTQNALNILHLRRLRLIVAVLVIIFDVGHQPSKKLRRRQLLRVTNNHNLLTSGDCAQSVHWLNLAGLINHQQIKLDGTRLQKLRYRQWRHHKNGLNALYHGASIFQKTAHCAMAPLSFHLASYNTSSTHSAMWRHTLVVRHECPVFRQSQPRIKPALSANRIVEQP